MRDSPGFLASVLDNVAEHICILSLQGEIIYTNHAWNNFACCNGLTDTQWVGQNYLDVCRDSAKQGDKSSEAALLGIEQIISGESDHFYLEYPCHSKTEKRWFLLNAKLLIVAEHTFVYVSHQQFQAESELRLYQERLALASKAAQIGIWDLNLKTNELIWDQQMCQIYGLTPSQFEGAYASWYKAVHPDDIEMAEGQFITAITDGCAFESTFRIILPDQQVRFIDARANVIRDQYHKPLRMVGINRDITDEVQHQREIKKLAYQDNLTHFGNRNQFFSDFKNLNMGAKTAAVCVINIRRFRAVNDVMGHAFGDEVLINLAAEAEQSCSADALFYRMSGDEFLLYIPEQREASFKTYISLFFNRLHHYMQHQFAVCLKAGCVLYTTMGSVSELLKQVDFALNEARDSADKHLVYYSDLLSHKYQRALVLMNDLSEAISQNALYLMYQPQYHDCIGYIGAEALVRWEHPSLGNISPAEFIPLAEQSNDITKLDSWGFEQVCKQLQQWQLLPLFNEFVISVNVSPRQLSSPLFYTQLKDCLSKYQVQAEKIKLEITEEVILDNTELVMKNIEAIRALGIHFALDDFGTGYSSLSYIKDLPLDTLKIDKSFIDDVHREQRSVALIKSVVTLCRGLGIKVVAEGVEQAEQYSILVKCGCFGFQGYFYSKPLLPDMLIDFLQDKIKHGHG